MGTSPCQCQGWNPWHHPYTHCAAWCPNYKNEPEEARMMNRMYWECGHDDPVTAEVRERWEKNPNVTRQLQVAFAEGYSMGRRSSAVNRTK
jgi:hypothetical protein